MGDSGWRNHHDHVDGYLWSRTAKIMFGQDQIIYDAQSIPRAIVDLAACSRSFDLSPEAVNVEVVFGYFGCVYQVGDYTMTMDQEILTSTGPKRMANIYQDGDKVLRLIEGELVESDLELPVRLGRQECYHLIFQRDSIYVIDTHGLLFQGYGMSSYDAQGSDRDYM